MKTVNQSDGSTFRQGKKLFSRLNEGVVNATPLEQSGLLSLIRQPTKQRVQQSTKPRQGQLRLEIVGNIFSRGQARKIHVPFQDRVVLKTFITAGSKKA